MSADSHQFPNIFSHLTGYRPMKWQVRLFSQFLSGKFPSALDLPTGIGKTSVMAIWLAARALAETGALKAIPRRLVYIVDRRAVVDQATEEAEKLRQALNNAAEHLKPALGLSDRELPISTLRGAHVDNREWLDDPAAPAIIVGTVDMIGSRLLFEGYGVSRKMRPFHAGLLGADTLVVLDEAHLVPPFASLLRRIANGAQQFGCSAKSDAELVPPFKLMLLSATGRAPPASESCAVTSAFCLEDEDLTDLIVSERLSAKKTVGIVKIGNNRLALSEEVAQQAWELSERGTCARILIYCDGREVAEKVKAELDNRAAQGKTKGDRKPDTELFVGARRVRERKDVKAWLENHGFLAGSPPPTKPAFLIATSAGEVGVDLDADHMVCDLVPWERMVQRLGRVNRRGQGNATIMVVRGDEPKPKKLNAPTDQESRQATAFRSLSILNELPEVENGWDASPGALRALKLRAETDIELQTKIESASTPEPLHPALTRALVDAWAMTSLEQHSGRPDVAPWLRGWMDDEPQTTLIWRTFLPLRIGDDGHTIFSSEKEVNKFFDAAPPHESEKLETETYRVVEWLCDRAKAILQPKSAKKIDAPGPEEELTDDASESTAAPRHTRDLQRDDIALLVLSMSAEYEHRYTLGELAAERKGQMKDNFHAALAGRILIVDARVGGLNHGVLDSQSPDGSPTADTDSSWSEDAGFRVRRAESNGSASRATNWQFEDDFILRANGDGDEKESLVIEHYRSDAQSEEGRSVSRPQELAEHQSCAEQKARCIGERLGLSGIVLEMLALAALLHDEGKRASNWQRAFRAPREKDATGAWKIFAKTRGPISQELLGGYRHEFGSLPVVEADARFKALPEDWRDLLLHLIAAHHGRARPVIGKRGFKGMPPSALDEPAREVALRFARLQKRWGPWGLAWWEALLRAADQQASRENDQAQDSSLREGK